jgi:hypothetical protein
VAGTKKSLKISKRYSGRVSSSCSTSDTRRVTVVTNPVISHECAYYMYIKNNLLKRSLMFRKHDTLQIRDPLGTINNTQQWPREKGQKYK